LSSWKIADVFKPYRTNIPELFIEMVGIKILAKNKGTQKIV
jgi:hypothetical protein